MKVVRMTWFFVLLLSASAIAREPRRGDSVVVITDQAAVQSARGRLATAPLGTRFVVKQKRGPWLLGVIHLDGRSVSGWMKESSVRVVEQEITGQPVHEFRWHNLLLARDKVDDNFTLDDYVDDYMQSTRKRVWEQARNDEFQLQRKRAETLAIIKKRLSDFEMDRDFMLKTQLTFQSYDFKNEMFPIKEATESNYWYAYSDEYSDDLPSRIEVYLTDPKMISGIPMDMQAAERFVTSRKTRNGSIDRRVYASIRLRITGVRSSGDLNAEVRWAQLFSDSGRTRLLYETPKSPMTEKADPGGNERDSQESDGSKVDQPATVTVTSS